MLFFTRWKAVAILLTALVVCLCAVPNFFPESTVKRWPEWAQRHIVLGLDLQGGSHLLLEVDSNAVRKERLQSLNDDVLRVLRQARIQFTGRAIVGNAVEVHITRDTDVDNALAKLRELSTAAVRHPRRVGTAQHRRGGERQRHHADADRPRAHRTHPPGRRSIDPDHRAPRQRARPGRADHPARRHRPHPGAGAGPAGSVAAQGVSARPRSSISAWSISRCRRSRRRSRARLRTPRCSTARAARNI